MLQLLLFCLLIVVIGRSRSRSRLRETVQTLISFLSIKTNLLASFLGIVKDLGALLPLLGSALFLPDPEVIYDYLKTQQQRVGMTPNNQSINQSINQSTKQQQPESINHSMS